MNKKDIGKRWRGVWAVAVFLLIWESAARLGIVRELFVSMPSKVIAAFFSLFGSGTIQPHLFASLETLLAGFTLAVSVGIAGGMILGYFPKIFDVFRPFLFTLSALPVVAMVPLVILWFGVGMGSKLFIVFFMAVVPILIAAIDGVRNIDARMITMARSFRANDSFILKNVVFYGALPAAFSGMRSAVGRSIVGLVISEAFGYGKGLGYLVVIYGGNFQTARLMAVLLVFFIFSLTATFIIDRIENKVLVWRTNN